MSHTRIYNERITLAQESGIRLPCTCLPVRARLPVCVAHLIAFLARDRSSAVRGGFGDCCVSLIDTVSHKRHNLVESHSDDYLRLLLIIS